LTTHTPVEIEIAEPGGHEVVEKSDVPSYDVLSVDVLDQDLPYCEKVARAMTRTPEMRT
jgi:hypothetical protein